MTWRGDETGRNAMTRGRETTQQPTKGTNERTNKQTKWVRLEATTQQEVKMLREGMEAADDFLDFFCWGERLCRSPFDVGISSTLDQISSVRGTSMSENRDTKVCRHTRNHVAKFALSG